MKLVVFNRSKIQQTILNVVNVIWRLMCWGSYILSQWTKKFNVPRKSFIFLHDLPNLNESILVSASWKSDPSGSFEPSTS